jgi:hypothetical protein
LFCLWIVVIPGLRILAVLLSVMVGHIGIAQFSVGSTTITFNDPGRIGGVGSGGGPGRQIQTEIYYPANSAGINVPVANGQFPHVVFGHGFVMTWSAYENIWQALVSRGYIVLLPRTEDGFSPSHTDFGLDIALVAENFKAYNTNGSSIFFW